MNTKHETSRCTTFLWFLRGSAVSSSHFAVQCRALQARLAELNLQFPIGETMTKDPDAYVYYLAETEYDNPAWWMVDLRGQFVVDEIVITNRDDGLSLANRLSNFQIDVFKTDPRQFSNFLNMSGDVCFNRTDPVGMGTFTWNCETPVIGRYVRLIRYGEVMLGFVELQVMVSQESILFSAFTRNPDSMLNISFTASTDVSSPRECVQRCLTLRSAKRCTAINWFEFIKRCQFLSIDTRGKDALLSQLNSSFGVNFYMESD